MYFCASRWGSFLQSHFRKWRAFLCFLDIISALSFGANTPYMWLARAQISESVKFLICWNYAPTVTKPVLRCAHSLLRSQTAWYLWISLHAHRELGSCPFFEKNVWIGRSARNSANLKSGCYVRFIFYMAASIVIITVPCYFYFFPCSSSSAKNGIKSIVQKWSTQNELESLCHVDASEK